MYSRKTHLTLSLILTTAAIALSSAAVFAAKPPSHPKNATTVDLLSPPMTPPCPGLAEVTGVYGDGLPYEYGRWINGYFMFHPPVCSAGREISVLLPGEVTSQLTPGEFGTCSGSSLNTPMLIIPSLLNAQTGIVDQNAAFPVRYSFHIDSDGDGWFETEANVIWHAGIHLTRTELTNPNRTVYQLTTALSSDYAEVRSLGASLGTFCIPLRLTVTRLK